MPEFSTLSLQEAILRTTPGRMRPYFDEYIGYLNHLRPGQAGKLSVHTDEKILTIRRRLGVVAQALRLTLTIKQSRNDVYFWEEQGQEAARPRRREAGLVVSFPLTNK